jgi:lysyl-tRNA synthetase class I
VDLTAQGVPTLYDEWDRFVALATAPDATPAEAEMHRLCVETTSKTVCNSPRRVSFRLLASVADITQANCEQMGRIIAMHVDEPATSIQSLLDALSRAWAARSGTQRNSSRRTNAPSCAKHSPTALGRLSMNAPVSLSKR